MSVYLTSDGPLDSLDPEEKARFLREIQSRLRVTNNADQQMLSDGLDSLKDKWRRYLAKESKPSPKLADARKALKREAGLADELVKNLDSNAPFLWYGTATDAIFEDPGQRHNEEQDHAATLEFRSRLKAKLEQLITQNHERLGAGGWQMRAGNLNIRKMKHGPVKRRFVRDCYLLFEQFLPGEASAKVEGDFHSFCELVYTQITGEVNGTLIRAVRDVIARSKVQAPK